jgi:hypothetical protein
VPIEEEEEECKRYSIGANRAMQQAVKTTTVGVE